MSKFLGEHAKFTQAIVGAAVSSADSEPMALKDVQRVTVHVSILNDLATAKAITAGAPASFNIVCGTAGQGVSSFAALSSAGLALGEATVLQWHEWETVRVVAGAGASAEKASTRQIIIDGTTFQMKEAATITDHQIGSSANSVIIENLACAIALYCTHLETYTVTTAADSSSEASLRIRRKASGPGEAHGIDIEAPLASASTGCVYVEGIKKSGVIEFRPSQVLDTAASYTHFGVRYKSTGTYAVTASVICVTGYQATNVNRTEL
jgi:hypothetical protein